jgi:hypothetical protein
MAVNPYQVVLAVELGPHNVAAPLGIWCNMRVQCIATGVFVDQFRRTPTATGITFASPNTVADAVVLVPYSYRCAVSVHAYLRTKGITNVVNKPLRCTPTDTSKIVLGPYAVKPAIELVPNEYCVTAGMGG